MSKNTFSWVLAVLICVLATPAYAGRVELTTYYPAPVGEYTHLEAKGNNADNGTTAFEAGGNSGTGLVVTNANRVGIGTDNPQASLDVPGGIKVGQDNVCNADKTGTIIFNQGLQRLEVCSLVGDSYAFRAIASGFPAPDFDSGWVSLPAGFNTFIDLPHNLNTMDLLVFHEGHAHNNTFGNTMNPGNKNIGSNYYHSDGQQGGGWYELLNNNTIRLRKIQLGNYNPWVFQRVKIWKINR